MRRSVLCGTVIAAAIVLAATSVTAPAIARPARPALHADTWCSTAPTAPCIVSVSRDGVAVPATSADWDVSVYGSRGSDGAYLAQWSVGSLHASGSYVDMGTTEVGHDWSVTVNMGSHPVRETDEYGDDVTVTKAVQGNGSTWVTIAGQPVTQGVNAECDTSTSVWTCPFEAGQDVTTFTGEISDFQQWNDPSQWNDFTGLDLSTNVEEATVPPEITGDPAEIIEQIVSSHELATGAVFKGFFHLTIPNAFLVDMGVDDPSTLSTAGLVATIGAGSVSIAPGPTSTQVDVTGITFSQRKLTVKRGKITPKSPQRLHARRTSKHHSVISFTAAKARGSKIHGYQVRCLAAHHQTHRGWAGHSPVGVSSLEAGVAYRCQARAKSKAGYGGWSQKATLAK